MTKEDIKAWWEKETGRPIPSGWDTTEEECMAFIASDSHYRGYNRARELLIKNTCEWLKQHFGEFETKEELVEEFKTYMEN